MSPLHRNLHFRSDPASRFLQFCAHIDRAQRDICACGMCNLPYPQPYLPSRKLFIKKRVVLPQWHSIYFTKISLFATSALGTGRLCVNRFQFPQTRRENALYQPTVPLLTGKHENQHEARTPKHREVAHLKPFSVSERNFWIVFLRFKLLFCRVCVSCCLSHHLGNKQMKGQLLCSIFYCNYYRSAESGKSGLHSPSVSDLPAGRSSDVT